MAGALSARKVARLKFEAFTSAYSSGEKAVASASANDEWLVAS
jgi:hypothetical protein